MIRWRRSRAANDNHPGGLSIGTRIALVIVVLLAIAAMMPGAAARLILWATGRA